MQRQKGFTLIELLVVLMIVAIIATIALPNFSRIIENNRITTVSNDLVGLLSYSRAEAIRRGANVTIGGDLVNGLNVLSNGNSLRELDMPGGSISITITAGSTDTLIFSNRGMVQTAGLARTYRVCGSAGSQGVDIVVTAGGQVRSSQGPTCP